MKVTKALLLNELKEIVIISLVAILFNVVLYDVTLKNMTISILVWVSLSKGNGYIVDFLNTRISWVHRPIMRISVGIAGMLVYTVLAFATVIIGANWLLSGRDPMEMLRRIEADDFVVAILITLIISMFFHGRAFYLNWKGALLREEKLKNESLKAQYDSLKNQVNPHFLFNSLNVLSGLVYEDQKRAVEFIRKMSEVYRYVLDKKDEELVTLKEELDFMKSYVYLQKIRFGENFNLHIDQNGEGMVPPLALQLLVENAIKHNTVSEARPLNVEVHIDGDRVIIQNNIQEKLSKDSTGIGLSNLKARYSYLTDRPVEVIDDRKVFRVILPLLQVEK